MPEKYALQFKHLDKYTGMNIYCYKRVSVELARWYPHRRIRGTTDKDRSSALGSIEVQVIVPPRYGSPDSLLEK
jgi:hypothetical protein